MQSAGTSSLASRANGSRVAYLARIARVYANQGSGPLSFWYEQPDLFENPFRGGAGYYMRFQGKAAYAGPFDQAGVPLLNYQGEIGLQHNPIAIAQYGLARFNAWLESSASHDRAAWGRAADWLTSSLKPNASGHAVWMHGFDWPYRQTLRAPWYSGLAQGNGVSMLVRAAQATGDERYADAAHSAFESFRHDVAHGGVVVTDPSGDLWIEEYIVEPPSHILNGFIWALWGVYDYWKWCGDRRAGEVWDRCARTLERRMGEFDTGWWSLYEAPHEGRHMLASSYYHALHITQLRVMFRLTGKAVFAEYADRFEAYRRSRLKRARAFVQKALFKLRHY